MNDGEKKCYINAVKCLQSHPAHNTSRPASWTRFDEFHATHIGLAVSVHYVVRRSCFNFTAELYPIYIRGNSFHGIGTS